MYMIIHISWLNSQTLYTLLGYALFSNYKFYCIIKVPEDTLTKSRFSFIEEGEPVSLDKLGRNKSNPNDDYNTYIDLCITGLLKVCM